MNHRFRDVVIALILATGIAVPVWLWMRAPSPESPLGSAISGDTPISGTLAVAVDQSLTAVAGIQAAAFSDQYPNAAIKLSQESSRPVLRLLEKKVDAALIEGALSAREDSLLSTLKHPVRRQPVARNALVFVVNCANPVYSVSIANLKAIFSGRLTDWKSLGGSRGTIVACLDGSNLRARTLLSEMLFGKTEALSASAEPDLPTLLDRVSKDRYAAAIMTLPEYAASLRSGYGSSIKAVPVSADAGGKPVAASPETIYTGEYPLSTDIFYLYDPYNPLATGFGAWLAKEGQKLFERGDMAPYEQLVRTIILK
ncbi:MAG TPA: phosphate-binding protein [Chlorobaculum sp.]|uniref:Phosphate-binding protein, putative n=1 Tax=Chlorobaculum tepidum (strain ATCC 49652 / DSM 12025 / NBRC 103806 / TLS) TaxID=194439 RepID=Q8KDE6_CHLTE|nr:substrate-binding domain-containing protein [Chlorobaculum tepidum]AAM72339.1 phosphate-binding protein, putative [Chlorobaculum tepidum TLS]HBU22706.1 phosphate-binding protein [Chlorobaculum sp.]